LPKIFLQPKRDFIAFMLTLFRSLSSLYARALAPRNFILSKVMFYARQVACEREKTSERENSNKRAMKKKKIKRKSSRSFDIEFQDEQKV
jgi:hypothetical protein